jgi:hypothetical protein
MDKAASTLTTSPRFVAFLDQIEAQRAREAKQAADADDAEWQSSNVDACRNPKTADACDGIRNYLARYRNGAHAGVANQLVDAAASPLAEIQCRDSVAAASKADAQATDGRTPAAEVLVSWQQAKTSCGSSWTDANQRSLDLAVAAQERALDEASWQGAGPEKCRQPKESSDCDGAQAYIASRPAGLHASEAKMLLKGSAKRIQALKRSEQVAAAIEARKADAAPLIDNLCQVLQRLDQVAEAEKLRRRVDAASRTENLYQKRQLVTARLTLGDQKAELSSRLIRAGVRFDRRHDCTETEGNAEDTEEE